MEKLQSETEKSFWPLLNNIESYNYGKKRYLRDSRFYN